MKTVLNVKVDKELKDEARKVAAELGVPLSVLVNSYLRQVVRDQEAVFSLKERKATPYLEKLIKEAEAEYDDNEIVGPFDTAEEFIASLNKSA